MGGGGGGGGGYEGGGGGGGGVVQQNICVNGLYSSRARVRVSFLIRRDGCNCLI